MTGDLIADPIGRGPVSVGKIAVRAGGLMGRLVQIVSSS